MPGQSVISALSEPRKIKWGKKLRTFFYFLSKNYERKLNKKKLLSLNFVSFTCSTCKLLFINNPFPCPTHGKRMTGVNYFNCPHLTSKGYLEHCHMETNEVNVDLLCNWPT